MSIQTAGTDPRLRALLYTDEIGPDLFAADYRAKGYLHSGRVWAKVDLGSVEIVAVDDEGLAGMQRLIDALRTALWQAKQVRQDADLELSAVPA